MGRDLRSASGLSKANQSLNQNTRASRLFYSLVAVVCLGMAPNGLAWHFQGVVWNDTNQDGIRQSGESGVANVTVQVLNCTNGAKVYSTTTASDGSFTVTDSNVPLNGDYQVCFTNLPAGYTFSPQIYPPPTNGTIVSTASPLTGRAPCFLFNQLTNNTLNNAGIFHVTNAAATALSSLVLCPGSPASFGTVVSGTGPFTYIWRLNGVKITSQTNNTLNIPSASSTNAGTYTVEVHGNWNSVTNSATLAVNASTTATALSSLTLCHGNLASFETVASGTGPFTYIWRFNGIQLAGQTNSTLSLPLVTSISAGLYSVEVYGSCNSVTNSATLTVNATTTATALSSQVLCPGSPASFGIVASGTGPFAYIWRLNGIQLAGQTNSTINISSVTSTNAGLYSVEVYGGCTSVTNSATLAVNATTTASALSSQVLCPGSSANFGTVASGTGPFAYIWRLNGVQITGQTNNTLSIPSVTSANAGTYSIEVYGGCTSVTNSATLAVNATTTATASSSQVLCPGSPASFGTVASGTGPFTYVWRLNGVQLTGQTNSTLNIPSVTSANAGLYAVEVYGGCTSVTNSATLTINATTTATALSSQVLCLGSPASFGTVASGTGPFAYIWRLNGIRLAGQTNSTLSISSVASTNAGLYSVEVYGGCTSVTNSATLVINASTTATALSSQALCPGSPASFGTVASGTGPFTYVWRLNGVQLTGQTNSTLNIPSVTSANAGLYAVEVYGGCTSVTNSATLTINATTTATALSSQVLCLGSPASFGTVASGTSPFTYIWRLNGVQITGQTNNTLSIPSVTSANAGLYSVEVYGSCNSVTNVATLVVNATTTATALSSLVKEAGSSATFSTAVTGTGPFAYIWRLNGVQLTGQSNNALNLPSVTLTNAGTYTVEVYGNCNSVTNRATLTIAGPPTVTILSPTNGATFIALANITVLAQVQDLYSKVTKVEFFAVTNAAGITNIPGNSTVFAATNKVGQTSSGPPFFILWTNITPGIYYLGARGTDALAGVGLSQIVTINVLDQLPVTSTGPMVFNPQTDVFEQPVRVTNPTYYTYNGVRLLIGNLAPGVQVYNATGITNGLPYVQSTLPIPPGGSVDFTIEYYVLSRIQPEPHFTVQLVAPMNAVNAVGPSQPINRARLLSNKSFLVEFNTLANRVYYLQYSSDLIRWNTAVPAIAGTGNLIDLIDNGPPFTAAPPATQPERFYRLILLP